jgi:hypothetical protein
LDLRKPASIGIVNDRYPTRGHRRYSAAMHGYATIREGMRPATHLSSRFFVAILWTAAAAMVQAGEIYKSIDANGTVVYSDHLDPSISQSVVQLENPDSSPRELHFCWTNCFTLILDNGVYRRTDGTDESWTVETFSAEAVVLHRHDAPADWNGYSPDVVYAGRVSNDRLIGVTVNGKPMSGVDASWGTALNTLPGSNAERDAKSTASPSSSSSGTASASPDSLSSGTVSTDATPPPLPAEDQPTLPVDGYLWTPGYWYWRDRGYFWIPGAWVRPPQVGVLWTPAYWGTAGNVFVFHAGHWGPTVGFYGGVNYGYGYFGSGYTGGHWIGNSLVYNSAINHLNPAIAHHTYTESPPNQGSRGVVSYTAWPAAGAGGPPGGAATHGGPPVGAATHTMPRGGNNTVPTTTVQRTGEPAPTPKEFNRPAAGVPATSVNKPPPGAPPKLNHATPTRAAPLRQ